jgi:replicative DNA helicase
MQTDNLALPKAVPYSKDAEQSVLGGLMLNNNKFDDVSDIIKPQDFFDKAHQEIFKAITYLSNHFKAFDVLVVKEYLDNSSLITKVNGETYLYELVNAIPITDNIIDYAKIVRDKSIMRQLIEVSNNIASKAYKPKDLTVEEILDDAETKILSIGNQASSNSGPKHIQTFLNKAVDKIDMLSKNKDAVTGVPTGFVDFDKLTAGLQESDLVIIAGRPSMGKTVLGVNIAENAAIKHSLPTLIFSLEMPSDAIAMRLISSLGHIDQQKLRTGNLNDNDWARISSAINVISSAKIFIDDSPSLTPTEVRSRARKIAKEQGQLGLIVIDYLQLMKVNGYKSDNRTGEISEISRSLKALAKELKVPVIALSQLNRSLESRNDKRPVMSDLRESGAIEQDADLVVFIYRDEVYNEESADKGIAEIIVAKQRNGPIGRVRLTFRGQFTRFENLAYTS